MAVRQHRLWRFALFLLAIGLAGLIALLVVAVNSEPEIPSWLHGTSIALGIVFTIGALIAWWYAIRFYARIHPELGIPRSAVYLAILIGFGWMSPILFIALEGPDRFFGSSVAKTEAETGAEGSPPQRSER